MLSNTIGKLKVLAPLHDSRVMVLSVDVGRRHVSEKVGGQVSQISEREKALENELVRKHEKELFKSLKFRAQEAALREEAKKNSLIRDQENDIYDLLPKDWAEKIAIKASEFYAQEKRNTPVYKDIEIPQTREQLDALLEKLSAEHDANKH